jgi:repressor LexA
MVARKSGNVQRGPFIPCDTTQMIEPRTGQPLGSHVVHRRHRRAHEARDLRSAAKCVDQSCSEFVHAPLDAIMVSSSQAEKYHNSNCRYGTGPVDRTMAYEEIQARMRELGYKQVDLANLLSVWPTAISKAFSGGRRFKAEEMDLIRGWLGQDSEIGGVAVGTIPVIAKVTAGNLREPVIHSKSRMPKPDPSIPDRAIALDVEGDSMDLFVPDGGRIIYDPQDRALWPRRFYVILRDGGETTFKRFFSDPARLEPCSTNPEHKPIILGGDETFTIVGRVIWQASKMPD